MPPPEQCPVCGGDWPPHQPEDHDRLADALHELYGPDFEPPRPEEGEAST